MNWRKIIWSLLFTMEVGCLAARGQPISLQKKLDQVADRAIARRVDRFGSVEHAAERTSWHWGSGVLMYGLLQSYKVTGDADITRYMKLWIAHHYEEGFHLDHTDRIMPAGVVSDAIYSGVLPERYDPILKMSYDYLMRGKRVVRGCRGENGKYKRVQLEFRGRSWLDDLFMCGLFMTRYALLNEDRELLQKVGDQFLAHIDLLQCHGEGVKVLNHGQWLAKGGNPFFPSGKVAWARANGWYLVASADYLLHTSPENDRHIALKSHFQEIIAEVPVYQKENGLFPTVLDVPKSYGEVAATALFVNAAATGLREGWIKGEPYYRLISRGMEAVLRNIDENGQVLGTSAGTPVMPAPIFYRLLKRGTYPWGEGAVMLALISVRKLLLHGPKPETEQYLGQFAP